MARPQQDQFIDEDEDEEVCPLCVEEFDLGDKNFRPCPCGYQICQFCYNNIKTTMNGLCPACRRPYDDKPFHFKMVSQEEILLHSQNKAAQQKKKAAAKQKEAQKREADNLSRKHLAGLRVRQKNLVYVTGMKPKIQGDRVAELLRGKDYFGQYGEIIKVVVSKSKDAVLAANQPVGIYVTFTRKEDAAACIEAINHAAQAGDGKIRAQHGTTKYCSSYLRGDICSNRNCMFLHEPGDQFESFSRQDLSSMNAASTQQPTDERSPTSHSALPHLLPHQVQPIAAATEDNVPDSPTGSSGDNFALPVGANWAQNVQLENRAAASSDASPTVPIAAPTQPAVEVGNVQSPSGSISEAAPTTPQSSTSGAKPRKAKVDHSEFNYLMKAAFNPDLKFCFAPNGLSEMDQRIIACMPPLWDPNGGAKKRRLKEREAEELRQQQQVVEAALLAPPNVEQDEQDEGVAGSLQLGGEPEQRAERPFGQGPHSAIQPPHGFGNLNLGHVFNLGGDDLSTVSGSTGRGITPLNSQQQQHLLLQQLRNTSTSHQPPVATSHGRQNSRFDFQSSSTAVSNAGTIKPGSFQRQQGTSASQNSHYSTVGGQQAFGGSFHTSGMTGPPPGLKTTGTPPVSGGGMFAQGHGFTPGVGYGSVPLRENDKMWDMHRGQRGNADAGKRGGGIVDGADPSILQARLHQNGASGITGQGLYGAGQGQAEFPELGQALDQPRTATPTLPPGLYPLSVDRSSQSEDFPALASSSSKGKIRNEKSIEHAVAKDQAENMSKLPPAKPVIATPLEARELTVKKRASSEEKRQHPAPKVPLTSLDGSSIDMMRPGEASSSTLMQQSELEPAKAGPSKAKLTKAEPGKAEPAEAEPARVEPSKAEPAKAEPAKAEMPKGKASKAEPTKAEFTGRVPLGKLEIPASTFLEHGDEVKSAFTTASKINISSRTSRAGSLTASIVSRPDTPTAAIISSGSPIRRTTQPRTLRITETPKAESSPGFATSSTVARPATPATPAAVTAVSKQMTRPPSVASINPPGTPISERQDIMSITSVSASVSRASSPPPMASGKAAKKREKQRQKDVETEVTAAPKVTLEEHAPITARKTKSKKNKTPTLIPAQSAKFEPSPASVAEKTAEAPSAHPEQESEQVLKSEEPKFSGKGKARASTPPKDQAPNQDSQNSSTSPDFVPPLTTPKSITAAAILQALESRHELALSTLSLLKPLTQQSELRRLGSDPFTPADLQNHIEQLRFELTKADEQILKQGRPVRKDLSLSGSRISGRNLVTPDRTRLACLTVEEEDRYLEIERRVRESRGIGRWGGGNATRKNGGMFDVLKALSVAAEPPEGASRHPQHQQNVQNGRDAFDSQSDAGDFVNQFVPPFSDDVAALPQWDTPSIANPASTFSPGHPSEVVPGTSFAARDLTEAMATAGAIASGQSVPGLNVRNNVPGGRETERALVEVKKETEAWEKKLNLLIKKNKKLVYASSSAGGQGVSGGH